MKEEEKAIGLLDSGLGGLSVFKELKKQLPQEQIIYCGDTAHAPYGEKNDEEILAYVLSIIDFLLQQNVKMIIIACNTATAVALDKVSQKYALPIIGVINPGAREAVKQTRNKRIGIIGTQVTIRRQSYEKAIREMDPSIVTYSNACSNQIIREMEEQALHNEKKITMLLRECVKPIIENDIDTLIWGCTHYPFLQKYIKKDIDQKVRLVDPSEATVRDARDWLQKLHLNNTYQSGLDSFFISGNPELFARIAEKLLGYPAGKFQKAKF
jgi:glutamate racemase